MSDEITRYLNSKQVKRFLPNYDNQHIQQLQSLIDEYGNEVLKRNKSPLSIKTLQLTIPKMLSNNVPVANNIRKLSIVKRNSFEHYELLYGDNALNVWNQKKERSKNNQSGFVRRYGTILGKQKYQNFLEKKTGGNSLEGFIKRHGLEEGKRRFEEYVKTCQYTHSLQGYMDKYGEIKGKEYHSNLYNPPRISAERMQTLYGDDIGLQKYYEVRKKISESFTGGRASKESLNVFLPIIEEYNEYLGPIYIGDQNRNEYFIFDNINRRLYTYDLTLPSLGLIFEYNGEHVHPPVHKLTEQEIKNWKCAWTKRSANQVEEYDEEKYKAAYNNGFNVIVLWRNDGDEYNRQKVKQIIDERLQEQYA